MELIVIVTTLYICLSLMLSPSAASHQIQLQSSNDQAHDSQLSLTTVVLSRKLRRLEAATLKGHGGKDFMSYNKQKEAFSGKQEYEKEKEADVMHNARKGTWQEWVERGDTSEFFTMDYSHVRRRRPIHNKFVPVGP